MTTGRRVALSGVEVFVVSMPVCIGSFVETLTGLVDEFRAGRYARVCPHSVPKALTRPADCRGGRAARMHKAAGQRTDLRLVDLRACRDSNPKPSDP